MAIIETTYGGELSLFEAEMRTLFSRLPVARRWAISALPEIDELPQIE